MQESEEIIRNSKSVKIVEHYNYNVLNRMVDKIYVAISITIITLRTVKVVPLESASTVLLISSRSTMR